MPEPALTLRDLNRSTLARQMLLQREALPVPSAIERLVGLQAQVALPPYVGLWTRLTDFHRENLATLIENRRVVKATMMRGTLHLATAEDYLLLRAALQPGLTRGWEAITKNRTFSDSDIDKAVEAVRQYVAESPRTFAEISAMLSERFPDSDVGAMRYAARMNLALIQVPISSGWSYPGNPKFTLAESWLGQQVPTTDNFKTLVFRYLAAFGPASVADMQTWSGLANLKESFQKLKPELKVYRGERGRELFDLPHVALTDADAPAPVRFLPEFDNLLLSHTDRTRIVADDHRSKVYLPALRVAATILIDGFVGGVWKIEKKKSAATLNIEPFAPLTKQDRIALTEEGERLIRFAESSAKTYEVRFAD